MDVSASMIVGDGLENSSNHVMKDFGVSHRISTTVNHTHLFTRSSYGLCFLALIWASGGAEQYRLSAPLRSLGPYCPRS